MESKLTLDEANKMAEDNHNLIYSFIRSKNLDIEEYYGIAAEGLVKASRTYKSEIGTFSTYAYVCMESCIVRAIRKEKNNIPAISLSDLLYNDGSGEDSGLTYESMIGGKDKKLDGIDETIDTEVLLNKLDDTELYIVYKRLCNHTVDSIAKDLGISKQYVSKMLKSIKDVIKGNRTCIVRHISKKRISIDRDICMCKILSIINDYYLR